MDANFNRGRVGAKGMPIEHLETRLQRAMRPVAPPPGYVQDLGRRLRKKTDSLILITQPAPRQYTWLLFLSLLSGSLLVVLGIRAFLGLIGVVGVAQGVKNQMDKEFPSTLRTSN